MSYFDNVIEEAMRLCQPYENIERMATQDSVVPLRYPVSGKNGRTVDSVVVSKGTEVRIGKWLKQPQTARPNRLTGLS